MNFILFLLREGIVGTLVVKAAKLAVIAALVFGIMVALTMPTIPQFVVGFIILVLAVSLLYVWVEEQWERYKRFRKEQP